MAPATIYKDHVYVRITPLPSDEKVFLERNNILTTAESKRSETIVSMPTYFITGANRGIGLEFVRQLSANPSNTIIAGVRSLRRSPLAELQALSRNNNVHIIECDVVSLDSISSLSFRVAEILSKTGENLNYIFNNAAINDTSSDTSLSLDPVSFQNHMNANVLGPAKIVEDLRQYLARGAVVMNMTSGLASMTVAKDMPKCCTYSISKAAQNMLSLHQARDLKKDGVIVFCMDPGWVKTKMGGKGAMIEPEISIKGMLEVLGGLKMEDSGKFYRYNGTQAPW